MSNPSEVTCPECGLVFDALAYFEEPDDGTVIQPRICTDEDEVMCKGCNEITLFDNAVICPMCFTPTPVRFLYIQPCNANGYAAEARPRQQA